jgi:formate dehydrogenase major subunit
VNIETTKALTCDVRAGRRASPATSRVTTAPHGTAAPDRDHPAERTALGGPEATA